MIEQGTVLVTGGAGLIGSALVWALNRQGHDRILIADILDRSAKWRNLAPLRFDDYLEAEALLPALDRGVFSEIKTILHLGACSSTTETDAGHLIRNNYEFTKSLADWAVRHGVRFVYASSAATYGALEGTVSESSDLAALRPLNMYGYSKHLFDLYASRHGLAPRILGLKYFNVFGPNEYHKGDMRSVVHKAFEQIRDTGRVKLFKSYRPEFADGGQRRDFLYVKDAVAMTLHLADQPGTNGLVNIGSGRSHTWLELVEPIFRALDKPRQVDFVEMPETLRPQYQYSTCAAIDRLRQSGFTRSIPPLADAVTDYVTGYLVPGRHLGDEGAAALAGRTT
jgi:ADP-L-glycero-D-manno-heptose 6-epimerase